MSLTEEERRILVQLELEKARGILSQIDNLMELGYWDTVANRLYYATLHAVSALLIHDGRTVGSHKGANIVFNQYYVRTGIVSMADGKVFSQLQNARDRSDYNCEFTTAKEDIIQFVEPAKALIRTIEGLILA